MALPELHRGDRLLVDARDLTGSAIGDFLVIHVPAKGEVHHGEVLVIRPDLQTKGLMWVGTRHIVEVVRPLFVNLSLLPQYQPAAPESTRPIGADHDLAARTAAILDEPTVAIDVQACTQELFGITRRDNQGGVTITYRAKDGMLRLPAADATPFVRHQTGARYATLADQGAAERAARP